MLEAVVGGRPPLESERMTVLHSYCELAGRLPESANPASRDHMDLLRGVAAEARLALERREAPSVAQPRPAVVQRR